MNIAFLAVLMAFYTFVHTAYGKDGRYRVHSEVASMSLEFVVTFVAGIVAAGVAVFVPEATAVSRFLYMVIGVSLGSELQFLVVKYVPSASIVGNLVIPPKMSMEASMLLQFFNLERNGGKLTDGQVEKAFGSYSPDPPYDRLHVGVLSQDQAKVLYAVAHRETGPEQLDLLMPGGDLAITDDQQAKLCAIFTVEQLGMLTMAFEARTESKKNSQEPSL